MPPGHLVQDSCSVISFQASQLIQNLTLFPVLCYSLYPPSPTSVDARLTCASGVSALEDSVTQPFYRAKAVGDVTYDDRLMDSGTYKCLAIDVAKCVHF